MTNAVESLPLLKNKIQESLQLLLRIGNVNEVLYIELENSVEKNQIIAEYNGTIEYEITDAKLLTRILLLDAFHSRIVFYTKNTVMF